jgi:hypothetical protein
MKIFFIALCLSTLILTVEAQQMTPGNGTVKGVVRDAASSQPIEYANVVIYSARDSLLVTGVITDATGKFTLKKIPDGKYYLLIQFMGYSKKFVPGITLNEKKHEADLGTINLETSSINMKEVEVNGYKSNVVYKIDKKVVDLSQSNVEAGASGAEALRNVPGVSVDLDGNVTLRGSSNFIILVDGKPSTISGKDILKQIPASAIDKIELVTNPSAKYEAEGTAGIINVILKKGTQGFNGIVNAMAGMGEKYSADFLFNFKRQKISYFFGGYWRNTKIKRFYSWDSKTIHDSDTNSVDFDLIKYDHDKVVNFRTGFDYQFDSKNSISLSGEIGDQNTISDISYPQYKHIADTVNRYTMNKSILKNPWSYYYINLNYQHKFDTNGQVVFFNGYFSSGGGNSNNENEEQLSNTSGQLFNHYYDKSHVYQDIKDKEIQVKADYTLPIGKTQKIEAGLMAKFRPKSSVLISEYLDTNANIWLNNADFSNRFDFYHNIYAGYLTYSKSWKKFEFQAGLRCEYADRMLDLLTTSKKYPYEKFDVFPSVSLLRKFGKMGQLQASYSRRINRPEEGSLNPFPEFSTNTIMVAGNPALKPEYINSCELNYMLGPLAIETYYREVINDIDGESFTSDGKGGLYMIPVNIDKKIYYGADISGGAPLAKWCMAQVKFAIYNYKMQGDQVSSSIPKSSTAYDGYLGARFKITKTTKIEAYGGFSSSTYSSQGKKSPYYYAGASLTQSFFKQMLTAKISINNPFNIFKYESKSSSQYTTSVVTQTREPNVVRFGLSYKINNYKSVESNVDKPGNINSNGKF